jgi:hypothetical protein
MPRAAKLGRPVSTRAKKAKDTTRVARVRKARRAASTPGLETPGTRRGARLVLTFDAATNAFKGTVENTTESAICSVRVEVHLSTGTELGPTPRTDLDAGESTEVALLTGGETFDTWTAHPEVSACSGA